jgi:riboflavin kinase/FMN adenylyltransferase
LGFPTANLSVDPGKALPPDGVYVTWAYINGRVHPSVTNIGLRPTFGDGQRNVEVYLLDFQGNLYGQELRIELVERLRGEKRFASAEELKAQIASDVDQARAILGVRK